MISNVIGVDKIAESAFRRCYEYQKKKLAQLQ